MRKLAIAAVIVGALLLVILIANIVGNEGCMPWQTPVGTRGSPFSETEDTIVCR